jgi:hypothetical protein
VKERPHDMADMYLAPVVLAVDDAIQELGRMDPDELALQIGLRSDRPDWRQDFREEALLFAVAHLIELHGWTLTWSPRGIRLAHGERHVVLGVPDSFRRYLDGAPQTDKPLPSA